MLINLCKSFVLLGGVKLPIASTLLASGRAAVLSMRRCRLKGIHFRSDTNRTGAEDLSFYYSRLLYCLNQILAVMLTSQHRVLSSKIVRPRAPCGARCIGHAVRTWSRRLTVFLDIIIFHLIKSCNQTIFTTMKLKKTTII